MLTRLLYTSTANPGLGLQELRDVLRVARDSNTNLDVTGLLCICKGQFLQALEGERKTVNDLYMKIAKDPRHQDCSLLELKDIENRSFERWSMQLIDLDREINLSRKNALLQYSGEDKAHPFAISADNATALLLELQAIG